MNLDLNIVYGIVLSTLLLLAGHYGRRYFEREVEFETPAIVCYAYGTGALWAGAALWLASGEHWTIAWGILAIDVLAGLLVALLYGLDSWIRHVKQESRKRQADLVERLASNGKET